ncbi:MAG: cation:proton antiporter [Pseudomonadota bacterium]|nr:cation:proton antiporter [Pseudomonadota bacterium]
MGLMVHSTSLIATIVASFVLAFAFGYGARLVRLPPLVGYLLAGVALGPFTPAFFVADSDLASQLAEIGVILLMFGVGLHFSIRDLLSVWKTAVPGAISQISVCLVAGVGLGVWWGWGWQAGILMGLAMSVASTIVVLRVLEERHLLDTVEGRISTGWLIVEDLAMILALVLLPSLAGQKAGIELLGDVLLTCGKVALFIALILVIGQRSLPWLLSRVARTGSRELFTLSVLACALGIAWASSSLFDVSLALGAFFAGVVLSESDLSHQAATDSLPLQDAFAVLFFVSVGMLFDPSILVRQPWEVLVVLAIILLLKSVPTFLTMMARGRSLHSALTVTAGLAQIGEFSFILVGLGVSLGLLPPEGRDLILAGALLSIAINPLIVSHVEHVSFWFATHPRFHRRRPEEPSPPPAAPVAGTPGHVIIVGHGRVGSIIAGTLSKLGIPCVIVERDRRLVEVLRRENMNVIWGDAASPRILEAAGISHAGVLIVATPHGLHSRRVLDIARELNPSCEIVARVHTEADVSEMERRGVRMAAMGERELALAMAGYTLKIWGMPDSDVMTMIHEYRVVEGEEKPDGKEETDQKGHPL